MAKQGLPGVILVPDKTAVIKGHPGCFRTGGVERSDIDTRVDGCIPGGIGDQISQTLWDIKVSMISIKESKFINRYKIQGFIEVEAARPDADTPVSRRLQAHM